MLKLTEGHDCWRMTEAHQGRFLIDGDQYFKDIFQTLQSAKEKILIVGWDWDTHVELLKGDDQQLAGSGYPHQLKDFLSQLVESNQNLEIYVLIWKPSPVFFKDREHLLPYKMNLKTNPRLRFVWDEHHPPGASHHQKVVVVDDQVAYCGGFDLTKDRWDTREHKGRNPLRKNGHEYEPFHDVQVRVEGPVAKDLGDLVRERWERVTGEVIPATRAPLTIDEHGPWSFSNDFSRVRLAIAKTEPKYHGHGPCREVERSMVQLIEMAQEHIYIENQYLTATRVIEAIETSLTKPKGPEIVVVLPLTSRGWFEKRTLVARRDQALERLRKADKYGRLGVYHPFLPDFETGVKVHSKLMIVDDHYLHIGSANLNNRSMALDTECNLIFDASEDEELQEVLFRFRCDLIAEHSGRSLESVMVAFRNTNMKSWLATQAPQGRHLEPVPANELDFVQKSLLHLNAIDREHPWYFDLPPQMRQKGVMCATVGFTLVVLLWFVVASWEFVR